MRFLKIPFVVCVVLLLAGTAFRPSGVNHSSRLGTSAILTADGPEPVPRPWVQPGTPQLGILSADGTEPVPRPWRGIAS